ncbi:MAG: FAD-binding protein, partial [Desulfobacteraceae bacterium]|nr:FAD-binding protein [Desulfobacteraceae bacterium]
MIGERLLGEFEAVVGKENAWTDPEDLHTYSYDAAVVDPSRPGIVLRPTTPEMLGRLVSLCNANGVPMTVRGSGTNLSGGTVP